MFLFGIVFLVLPVAVFVWIGGLRYLRRLVGAGNDVKGKRRRSGAYQRVGTSDLEK
jgi:hypothetical protein